MPRQALSPCRGSDLGIRDSGHRHRGPAPTEPAAATARCEVSPDPHRLARTLTARSRPQLRPRHRWSPSSSSVTTRLPLATTQATSCPDWNRSFTAVRITRMAPSGRRAGRAHGRRLHRWTRLDTHGSAHAAKYREPSLIQAIPRAPFIPTECVVAAVVVSQRLDPWLLSCHANLTAKMRYRWVIDAGKSNCSATKPVGTFVQWHGPTWTGNRSVACWNGC
jgi:hypothetical protein